MLAACQQSGPAENQAAGLTGPSAVDATRPWVHQTVGIAGVLPGDAAFDVSNPKGCGAGFTTITDAKGPVSHLGLSQWHSEHCFGPAGQLLDAEFVLTAASGDKLYGTYTGNCDPPGAIGEQVSCRSNLVFSAGTGRFEHASGEAEMKASVLWEGTEDFSSPGRWEFKGSIKY
jgi:hypothetical protein